MFGAALAPVDARGCWQRQVACPRGGAAAALLVLVLWVGACPCPGHANAFRGVSLVSLPHVITLGPEHRAFATRLFAADPLCNRALVPAVWFDPGSRVTLTLDPACGASLEALATRCTAVCLVTTGCAAAVTEAPGCHAVLDAAGRRGGGVAGPSGATWCTLLRVGGVTGALSPRTAAPTEAAKGCVVTTVTNDGIQGCNAGVADNRVVWSVSAPQLLFSGPGWQGVDGGTCASLLPALTAQGVFFAVANALVSPPLTLGAVAAFLATQPGFGATTVESLTRGWGCVGAAPGVGRPRTQGAEVPVLPGACLCREAWGAVGPACTIPVPRCRAGALVPPPPGGALARWVTDAAWGATPGITATPPNVVLWDGTWGADDATPRRCARGGCNTSALEGPACDVPVCVPGVGCGGPGAGTCGVALFGTCQCAPGGHRDPAARCGACVPGAVGPACTFVAAACFGTGGPPRAWPGAPVGSCSARGTCLLAGDTAPGTCLCDPGTAGPTCEVVLGQTAVPGGGGNTTTPGACVVGVAPSGALGAGVCGRGTGGTTPPVLPTGGAPGGCAPFVVPVPLPTDLPTDPVALRRTVDASPRVAGTLERVCAAVAGSVGVVRGATQDGLGPGTPGGFVGLGGAPVGPPQPWPWPWPWPWTVVGREAVGGLLVVAPGGGQPREDAPPGATAWVLCEVPSCVLGGGTRPGATATLGWARVGAAHFVAAGTTTLGAFVQSRQGWGVQQGSPRMDAACGGSGEAVWPQDASWDTLVPAVRTAVATAVVLAGGNATSPAVAPWAPWCAAVPPGGMCLLTARRASPGARLWATFAQGAPWSPVPVASAQADGTLVTGVHVLVGLCTGPPSGLDATLGGVLAGGPVPWGGVVPVE